MTQSVYTGVEEAARCPSSWTDGAQRAREEDKDGKDERGGKTEGKTEGGQKKPSHYCISEVSVPEDKGL